MKIIIQIFYMTFMGQLLISCKPEQVVKPMSNIQSSVIWKYERDCKGLASNNYIYGNLLIQGTSSSEGKYQVVALTLDSGKMVWKNEGFPGGFDAYDQENAFVSKNKLVITYRTYIRVINLDNGESLWDDNLLNGDGGACIIGNYVYKAAQTSQNNVLYRYNLQTGIKTPLFILTKAEHGSGIYQPFICRPVNWVSTNGNELLIMHSQGWSGNSYRMDVMAYNLTADSMEWYRKGISDWASSSRPTIEENRVYFFSISKVICIEASTGNTLWDWGKDPRDNYSGFKTANVLLVKDKIIAKPDSEWMYGLDKLTGSRLWTNEKTSPMPNILREYNDTIWFSSGGIFAIDANSGRTLIDRWKKANLDGFWSNPIVKHPSLGYIYTTDGDYIYCLDPRYMN